LIPPLAHRGRSTGNRRGFVVSADDESAPHDEPGVVSFFVMAKKRREEPSGTAHDVAPPQTPPDAPDHERPGARADQEREGELIVLTFAVPSPAFPSTFSAAEREVALAVIDGRTNAQIAAARKTSLRTVANQIVAMYRKLGVHSRSELVVALTSRPDGRTPRA
jgi:DNA-binding CsgD family transcriptional regulator